MPLLMPGRACRAVMFWNDLHASPQQSLSVCAQPAFRSRRIPMVIHSVSTRDSNMIAMIGSPVALRRGLWVRSPAGYYRLGSPAPRPFFRGSRRPLGLILVGALRRRPALDSREFQADALIPVDNGSFRLFVDSYRNLVYREMAPRDVKNCRKALGVWERHVKSSQVLHWF